MVVFMRVATYPCSLSILKVEIKKAEPRDASKAQEEGGQWGTHPDNHWGMPVGPPGMPGLNNVSTSQGLAPASPHKERESRAGHAA